MLGIKLHLALPQQGWIDISNARNICPEKYRVDACPVICRGLLAGASNLHMGKSLIRFPLRVVYVKIVGYVQSLAPSLSLTGYALTLYEAYFYKTYLKYLLMFTCMRNKLNKLRSQILYIQAGRLFVTIKGIV